MSPSDPKHRLAYVVVCDQTRTETSNKMMFIGTYGSAIVVEGSFPAFLPSLVIAACIRAGTDRREKVKVKITLPGVEPLDQETTLDLKRPFDTVTFQVQFFPCVLVSPGTLSAEFTFADGHMEMAQVEVISKQQYTESTW